jgi:3-phenylpropionate/trans-cinnamate dioxygenase ferredoxin reductase subunit
MMEPGVVIVGAGQAACQAAASLRQMGYAGALTIVGEEVSLPYQRPPLSKSFLQGTATRESIQLRPPQFYQSIGCDVLAGSRAVAIERQHRLLHLENGTAIGYRQLVLATGARARLYPGLPHETGRIHYLRTLEDAAALSSVLAHARRLAIVGAGYVGMEVAASARQLGIEVAVYEAAPRIMQRSIGAATSDVIEAFHRQQGVRLHLNTSIERIEADRSGALAIHVTDAAAPFAADALVIGIGAEPNVDLAALAGIDCGRAIRVDADCRTSDSAIFAIGDCTEQAHPLYGAGLRLESVQNAIDQAKCAAAAIAGKPAPPVGVPWFWSDQYQHRLQVAGLAHGHDQSVVRIAHDRAAGSVSQSVWYLRKQRVIAVEALDAPQDFMVGRTLIRHGTAVTAARLADAALPLQAEATTGKGT